MIFAIWFAVALGWGGALIVLGLLAIWARDHRGPRFGEALGMLALATTHGSLWFISIPLTVGGLVYRALRRTP